MSHSAPKPEQFPGGSMAAALAKNKALLESLAKSPDTRRLMELLSKQSGGGLQSAAQSAAHGDTAALTGLVRQVMSSQEGAELIQRIRDKVPQENQQK